LKEPPSNEVHRDCSAAFLWQALKPLRGGYYWLNLSFIMYDYC